MDSLIRLSIRYVDDEGRTKHEGFADAAAAELSAGGGGGGVTLTSGPTLT